MAIVDLNASGLGLIRSEEDITTSWVQGVLHGSGALPKDVTVTGFTTDRIGEGVGILSVLQRVTPTYSNAAAGPKSFVVKYPTSDGNLRFAADALEFYIRELIFYRDCAPDAPFKTAKCYGQAIASDNTDFTIAMEDIGYMRPLNQLEGVSLVEAKKLLEVLADFHAMWWGSPKLEEIEQTFKPVANPTYEFVLPPMFSNAWPAVQQHAGDLIPDSVAKIGEIWSEKCMWMLQNMMSPKTLCHGDFRADNLMFDGDHPAVIDFQITGTGSGMYDVAYFISQSIHPDVRHGHDEELLNTYFSRLDHHGVTYERKEMMRQYLIGICFCVTYSVTAFPSFEENNDRGKSLLRDMLNRSLRAVVDNDALKVLL